MICDNCIHNDVCVSAYYTIPIEWIKEKAREYRKQIVFKREYDDIDTPDDYERYLMNLFSACALSQLVKDWEKENVCDE